MSQEEFEKMIQDDIDPAAYAGEGISSTEEIPVADSSMNKWLKRRIGREGDYWP